MAGFWDLEDTIYTRHIYGKVDTLLFYVAVTVERNGFLVTVGGTE